MSSGREIVVEHDGMQFDQSQVPAIQAPAKLEPAIGTLVERAIDKGVDVTLLEQLVSLQERIYDRDARAAFIAALSAFRQACPPIPKTRENSQFSVERNGVKRKSKYAALEDIERIAGPVAAQHGLVWTWDTRVEEQLMHVTCRVLHAMGHSESATVTMPHGSNAGSSPQQKYGSTQTYGMRYSLIAALGITTADEDTDGNAGGNEGAAITEAQAADLSSLIEEVGVNKARFLDFMGCDRVADIAASDYTRAVRFLEKKRAS